MASIVRMRTPRIRVSHELWLEARERVEVLREEADQVLAELAETETDWERWVIARQRVGGVLAVPSVQESASAVAVPATDESAGPGSVPPRHAAASPAKAVRAGSIVPVWRPGLEAGALAVEYQRILQVLTERRPARAERWPVRRSRRYSDWR
ncbi:hypothetical protein [Streptomyces mirabilis]|uniref:hypothetical protein n=1 Tax=Streptomyces mirabilis TaxID=68239 RepID=UPI0033A25678